MGQGSWEKKKKQTRRRGVSKKKKRKHAGGDAKGGNHGEVYATNKGVEKTGEPRKSKRLREEKRDMSHHKTQKAGRPAKKNFGNRHTRAMPQKGETPTGRKEKPGAKKV